MHNSNPLFLESNLCPIASSYIYVTYTTMISEYLMKLITLTRIKEKENN